MKDSYIFSIVVPSYNQSQFIRKTIDSIISQKGDFFIDIIIVDGGSSDETLEIIKSYQQEIERNSYVGMHDLRFFSSHNCEGVSFRWESEKDNGQAHAINKGFLKAKGTIVSWLNSDDFYSGEDSLQKVSSFFRERPEAKFLYGKGYKANKAGDIVGDESYVVASHEENIKEIDYILQPSAFWRSEVLQSVGLLNEDYHYVLDWDYWIRISEKYSLFFIEDFLACNRIYEETKTSSGGYGRYLEIIKFLVKNDALTEKSLWTYAIANEVHRFTKPLEHELIEVRKKTIHGLLLRAKNKIKWKLGM